MIYVQNFVSSFFLPKPFQKNGQNYLSQSTLAKFKRNYTQEKCKSLIIKSTCCISSSVTLGYTITDGLISTATLVSVIATGILSYAWSKWANKSSHLAINAYHAIAQHHEKEAIQAIMANANIFHDFTHLSLKEQRISNLFTQAASYDCREVIKCLASLGWNINTDPSALGRAPSLHTAQLLVKLGANVNLYDGIKSSPLFIQLCCLISILKKQNSSLDFLNQLEERSPIIDFLLQQGAKLQENPPKFNEKNRAQEALLELFSKITSLHGNDLKIKEQIREHLENIQKKL